MKILVAVLLASRLLSAAHAGDTLHLPGNVVRVVDGDTVVVEADDNRYRVRLATIDAPERDQPWGEAWTRSLRQEHNGLGVTFGDWHPLAPPSCP